MRNNYLNAFKNVASLNLLLLVSEVLGQDASVVTPGAYSSSTANFVRSWVTRKPETNASNVGNSAALQTASMTTDYYDGLGRMIQKVEKQGVYSYEATNFYDRVTPIVYDDYGRIQRSYLPYQPLSGTGTFKLDPFADQNAFYSDASGRSPIHGQGESFYYGKTEYEPSPLNRVVRAYAPGNNWVHEGRGTKADYWTNTVADSVKIWNVAVSTTPGTFSTYSVGGNYTAGELCKQVVTDEHSKQTITFTDKQGLVILKKVQLTAGADTGTGSGHVGWLCTYYLYDHFQQLRAVVQPQGVKEMAPDFAFTTVVLENFTFRYEYDSERHQIVKKVPGAGEAYMVFDKRDRLVLTQDANLRAGGKWFYIQYDDINRPVATGLWTTATSFSSHLNSATGSSAYPNLSGQTYTILTKTFYDNYNWRASEGNPLSDGYNTTWNTHFLAASTIDLPYPVVESAASAKTKGLVTGSMVNILGTSTNLYTVSFYDDKGRVIQVQSQNITGGEDVLTNQYSWDGRLVISVQKQEKGGANAQTTVVVTKYHYVLLGLLANIQKKISNTLVNGGTMSEYNTIATYSRFDVFDRVKRTSLGYLWERLEYEYNIRGWLLGVNRNFAKDPVGTDRYFGFDLGYDKTSVGSIGGYSNAQYNGNISGAVWKNKEDNQIKKYEYSYDAVNRIIEGNYKEYVTGTSWSQATQNYSMDTVTYDLNGNILALNRKTGSGQDLDVLTYTYTGNQLKTISDAGNTGEGFINGSNLTQEYFFDDNGNMTRDLNKAIDNSGSAGITYNHLNLPTTIMITGKGSIDYVYDATGVKLKKVVHETGQSDKITLYMNGLEYTDDVLQFIKHEEGRVVLKPETNTFRYEFFLKDHLGNTRMVITPTPDVINFPATFESEDASQEETVYSHLPETRVTYINADANSDGGNEVVRLNATSPSGAGLMLPVTKGDTLDMTVYAYYEGGSGYTSTISLTSFVAGIAGAFGGLNGGTPSEQAIYNTIHNAYNGGSASMLGTSSSTVPAAYLNYILFDENMGSYQFGYVPMGSAANMNHQLLSLQDVIVNKRGFAYIYLTNESATGHVYFDDIQVILSQGNIIQVNDYDPFGLAFNSYSRVDSNPNNCLYNGMELQVELDLSWYDYGARMYDPTIARWMVIDPQADLMRRHSSYNYAFDNPIRFIDPDGMRPEDVILLGPEKDKAFQQLQAAVQNELTLSMNKKGKVTYTKNSPNAKLSDNAQQLADAIDDHSVQVQVTSTTDIQDKEGNYIVGGQFVGARNIIDSEGNDLTVSKQIVNVNHTEAIDTYYETPGATTLHEVTESYQGAKLVQGRGQNSGNTLNDPNTVFYDAHRIATPAGTVHTAWYGSNGKKVKTGSLDAVRVDFYLKSPSKPVKVIASVPTF